MPESELINLIKSIKDSQSATIKLHTIGGADIHLDCIYKESIAPNFFVVFPPGKIPENLDPKKACAISFHDDNKESPALNAKITDITNDRTIELTGTTTIDPSSLREYFRVDFRTRISISFESRAKTSKAHSWSIIGQTLDLSGSGVLSLFNEKPRNNHSIFIEIALTHPVKNILCIGHVVRIRRLRRGNYQVAIHFDNLTQKNRDALITNCFWEQRRQLRERIQIN
ncbi:PilZ domain-containing protein [Desulfosediminicola flagellatus]|uniref:PilZ domain-containing protein n=1 Tax=Desulfosediminicola flagellatus TaxID=2569541 RepID=UPI0010AD84CB|nr:PilZ domain-containing protein [Desulfosediminicola flagellatus]